MIIVMLSCITVIISVEYVNIAAKLQILNVGSLAQIQEPFKGDHSHNLCSSAQENNNAKDKDRLDTL